MALLGRRDLSETFVDDQSPTLRNSYVGKWTKQYDGNYTEWYLGTYTYSSNHGDSLSLSFTGTQLWLYGGLSDTRVSQNGNFAQYPTAEYLLDGNPVGSQQPYFDSSKNIVYFKSQDLEDGPHTFKLTVTAASQNNLFMVDWFAFTFIAGGSNSTSTPAPTPHPTHIGAIVGGVVGGLVGIAILIVGLWRFLRRRSRGEQAYYFEKPNPVNMVIDEYQTEPFDPTIASQGPSSATFNGPSPQSANSDGDSNWPSNPPFRQGGAGSLPSQHLQSENRTQSRTGKAALAAQQKEDVQPPVQYEDSGVRFDAHEGGEPGPSQLPKDVPPTYTQS